MKCPHCMVEFHDNPSLTQITRDNDGFWYAVSVLCPSCFHTSIELHTGSGSQRYNNGKFSIDTDKFVRMAHPKSTQRPPVPKIVDPKFAEDYLEACLVLSDSPKASAALARRCLQTIIREKLGIKERDLAIEIQKCIENNIFPSYISDALDAVRAIGNFAAHPIKSTSSGQIVEVEPGEAEWTLDVIESLFDFLFVQPAILDQKRDAINQKLQSAGKPPIKQSVS